MTTEQAPAGWYPDPSGKTGQKYWDGREWDTGTIPTNAPAAGQPAPYPPVTRVRQDGPDGGIPSGAAPYGGSGYAVDVYGHPLSDKSKLVAGLLQIFLGSLGIGRFYLGYTTIGILQIVVTVCTFGLGAVWPLIDGIMIIIGKVPDAQGRTLRE